jgi:Domain of unknown function (DUF1844)
MVESSSKTSVTADNQDEVLPVIDFATFIVSLSHSALMHMGHAPHPETQVVELHLPLAKQTIDLLGLLEQKTKGNLAGDEERLLGQILYELRTKYVSVTKSG